MKVFKNWSSYLYLKLIFYLNVILHWCWYTFYPLGRKIFFYLQISLIILSSTARQTYETLCAPPVECWDEKEEISICDRKFVLPEQKDEFLRCIRFRLNFISVFDE